ncbi:Lsr2 family protein [Nocardioides sp.]|uniref:histone-like nucleoid-structuring protein Lsr2 n=1 Tax=Nocardioides sp. TaxID=35761 RepID=UPI00262209CB|nr:Lsr2 family protein [Nocardioides sp.]
MAQKVQIILEDDLDGGEADETVSFALDGTSYEIDLNEANATKMREALAPYVGHARKVTGSRGGRRTSTKSSGGSGPSPKEVREWARENGHDVPDRGRIPAEVREAYDAAH